jgi:hypothetical protein
VKPGKGGSLGVLVFVASAASLTCGDNRGGEVPAIYAALERLPGVRVIDVVGWDEMWPLFGPEDIRADLQIGKGGRLRLCDLTLKKIVKGGPFIIARVGDWSPGARFRGRAEEGRFVVGCPNSVDVKPRSAFVELLPVPINSPAEAVANYSRLETMIASWPENSVACQTKPGVGEIEYWKSRFSE